MTVETMSLADRFKALPKEERERRWNLLSDEEKAANLYDWSFWARPNQLAPPGDWQTWLILAGRGFGKTKAGAQWIISQSGTSPRMALVGPTAADVRDAMIEGESGILASSPPWNMPRYEPSKRKVTWPNGSFALCFSAEEPKRLRGPQFFAAWCDELAAWKYDQDTYDMLQFGLRLGKKPRQVITTTPRPTKIVKDLKKDKTTALTTGTSYENRSNLAPSFFDRIVKKYEGTRLGRQELNAEILDDNPGALWTLTRIDLLRVPFPPPLQRVVVGVDPAVSSNPDSDETGIIVCGLGFDGHGYVLDDRSLVGTPDEWGQSVVDAYSFWEADRVIAEVNNGGDLVEANLRTIDKSISYKAVHATRGKLVRAEPISALYEQGKVHHVGAFAALEDQMTQWDPSLPGQPSPDRVDACLVAGTLVTTIHGDIPIEKIVPGMIVLTRAGFRRVNRSGMTRRETPVLKVSLSNGDFLVGTGNHPVFVCGKGFVTIESLVWGDIIVSCAETLFFLMELSSSVTRIQRASAHDATSTRTKTGEGLKGLARFIALSGRFILGRYLTDVRSTTGTEIHSTTQSKISNALLRNSILSDMPASIPKNSVNRWIMRGFSHLYGIAVRKGLNFTDILVGWHGKRERYSAGNVIPAESNIKQRIPGKKVVSAPANVSTNIITSTGHTTKTESVSCAVLRSMLKNQKNSKSAPVNVVGLSDAGTADVYNLEVDGTHEYFANGVLVHNCVWALTELMIRETSHKLSYTTI